MRLWLLEPVGELEFGGDVVFEQGDEPFRRDTVGPVRVQVRWDPSSPEWIEGEISGDPEHARHLGGGQGPVSLVGRVPGGSTATVRDVFFTTIHTSQTHEYGPRLLANFIAGDVELRRGCDASGGQLRHPEVLFHIPDDPVWLGFTGRFGFEPNNPIEPPPRKFEALIGDLHIETTHLVYSGGAQFGGNNGRGQRISLAIKVTGRTPELADLDHLIKAAEEVVGDTLLVAGLAAHRPFHVLGGYASVVKDTEEGRVYEWVEFTRSRTRHPVRKGRSFNDVQIEQERFQKFLGTAIEVLASDPQAEFLRLALQIYIASMYRAFDTQQFLSVCTAIEALKEWHSKKAGWDKLLKKKEQSAVSEHVRRALIEAAKEGVLHGRAHQEAREKILELFHPRISTVLNELVQNTGVQVDDLFNRDERQGPRGPFVFDFLSVRNKLVHQGKPPQDQEAFYNVSTRARYFAERLLFAILGYREHRFLKLQYNLEKPTPRK